MLAFAKHRLPEQFLCFLTQCHRHPQCIYATCAANHVKQSEHSAPQPMGYQFQAGYPSDINLMLAKSGRHTKTILPNHHHLSQTSITEFNFDAVEKFPDMTDHCKFVLQRLKGSVHELSKQTGESDVDSCGQSPDPSLQPTRHAMNDTFKSHETSRQQWCVSSDVFFSVLLTAQGTTIVSPDKRVCPLQPEDVESVNCDYSVWPWSKNLCDFSEHDMEMEKNKNNNDLSISYQFLPAEHVSIDNGQLCHTRPMDIVHSDNARYFNDNLFPDLRRNDFGYALLGQFVDHNGLQYSELHTRQVVFKRTPPSLSQAQGTSSGENNLPSADQLRLVQDYMPENMPRLFLNNHDYNVYTDDLLFENSWYSGNSYTTVGRLMYTIEVAKLRLFVHLRLANVRVHLLKTTSHIEDGTVKVRWRVSGIPQTRAFMFWNFLPWNKNRHSSSADPEWLDGISTFFVNRHGQIFKHKMDRVISDEDRGTNVKASVIEKLRGIAVPAT